MTVKTTTDHNEIKNWIMKHGGRPAVLAGVANISTLIMPQIRFSQDADLREISWEQFFEAFELNRLAFRYDTDAVNVDTNASCILIRRHDIPTVEENEENETVPSYRSSSSYLTPGYA